MLKTLTVIVSLTAVGSLLRADEAPRYATEVRPILAAQCFACHGADDAARKGDLRLDLWETSGEDQSAAADVIDAGNPEEGEFIRRITTAQPDEKMPPPDSGHALTDAQIDILRRWIAAGAEYEAHWSFASLRRPELPPGNSEWVRNPIDRFVLRRLIERKLKPSPQADPYRLIRRVYLDLTGLPPAPEVADEFARNPDAKAWEAVVDRLLTSPRFGEHWASMWLDLARYADTKGYEKDQPREIWRYRDWVIDAFNRDLPFDQFTTEQIAGDLLDDATTDQILATAFHRNTMTNDEGGTDNEEFRIAAVKDRVDTTIQVWMGLTMGCAKCHSHKYDPVTQREYYQFMAFFNQTEDADRGDDAPRVSTPTPEQQRQLSDLEKHAAAQKARRDSATGSEEFRTAQRQWESEIAGKPVWEILRVTRAVSANGSTLTVGTDQSVLASGEMPPTDVYELTLETDDFTRLTAVRVEAMTDDSLPRMGPGRNKADPNFVLSELTAAIVDKDGTELQSIGFNSAKADFSQKNWQVAKAIDGQESTGWAVSPKFGQPHNAIFGIANPLAVERGQLLRIRLSQQYQPSSLLMGRVRIYVSNADPASLDPNGALQEAAALAADVRTGEQKRMLRESFSRIYPATRELTTQIEAVARQLSAIRKAVVSTPIMRDLPPAKYRKTHIHVRGNFLDKGDSVEPGFPARFSDAVPQDYPNDRRAVAAFLVAPANPLTARVTVNRVWARIFGRGLVETEEDFGTQGMLPTHPQLLDWLAVEFRDTHDWSFRKLCKSIVMSAVYQQASVASERSKQIDSQNIWMSRGARYRLPAETIRDQSLAVSGLLSDRIGGPSVMPPQPDGIWKATYSTLKWKNAEGEDRYRRGLYTFLRRTSPYPSLITFDGTSREVCQIRRIRTNTPSQALVLLNDSVYVEASGALAASVMSLDESQRLDAIFRRVLIRPPTHDERERVKQVYRDVYDQYADLNAAEKLLKAVRLSPDREDVRELATLTMIASVVLNTDECISRP